MARYIALKQDSKVYKVRVMEVTPFGSKIIDNCGPYDTRGVAAQVGSAKVNLYEKWEAAAMKRNPDRAPVFHSYEVTEGRVAWFEGS